VEALLELLNKKLAASCVKPHRVNTKPGGRAVNKTKIALAILKNKRAREMAFKALKNDKVRKVVVKQVSRRLTGK
jgi:hypothetical protein